MLQGKGKGFVNARKGKGKVTVLFSIKRNICIRGPSRALIGEVLKGEKKEAKLYN